ncbi:MAG: ATP-binding protein [Planctomycetota bacterium]
MTRPTLMLFKGHPGTGKSTVAEAWRVRCSWPLLDKDDFKDVLLEAGMNDPRANDLSYELLWRAAGKLMGQGHSVITVSPLSSRERFGAARSTGEQLGARVVVVECRLDEDTWRQRLAQSPPDGKDHRIRSWPDIEAMLERSAGAWNYAITDAEHIVLDTALPMVKLLETLGRVL